MPVRHHVGDRKAKHDRTGQLETVGRYRRRRGIRRGRRRRRHDRHPLVVVPGGNAVLGRLTQQPVRVVLGRVRDVDLDRQPVRAAAVRIDRRLLVVLAGRLRRHVRAARLPVAGTGLRRTAAPAGSGKRTKSRAIAGLVSAVLGTLLVAGGLYLIGEFGFRIFDVMLNGGGQPSPWDIAWTSTGAGLIFVAVLLNGWSPWATLVPGIALTAAGVWSIAWYDGADRVASSIDRLFARPEMVVWGITGWMLVLGLMLLGASGAVDHRQGRRPAQAPRTAVDHSR